jgi:hypothetical protein
LYYTVSLFVNRGVALAVTGSFCLFVATFSPVFAVYNSEHVSVCMVAVSVAALVSYIYRPWNRSVISLLVGILLGSLVYAKFQNVPMGMLTGAFLVFLMIQEKSWRNVAAVLAGALLPTLVINIYYASLGKLDVFWNSYFWNYYYYSYTTQFSSMPIERRFSPGRVIAFLFFSPNSALYLATLGGIILAGLFFRIKKWGDLEYNQKVLLSFALLLLLLTVYAVLQSGNDFQHYKLYLFLPLSLLVAIVISLNENRAKLLLTSLLVGSILQTAANVKYLDDHRPNADLARMDSKVIESINRHSGPADPITVWGWRDQLHVWTRRPLGYRNVHPFHFSMKSPLIPFWTREFLEDMEANKPRLFIEAMVPNYSERAEKYLTHDKVPVINAYVKKHYRFVENLGNVKVFRRRD